MEFLREFWLFMRKRKKYWLLPIFIVLILFGGGRKISELMRGTGKGIREFKKALKEDDESEEEKEG